MRFASQQAAKPGTRFMRCSGNVTRHDERWQAVFLCVHGERTSGNRRAEASRARVRDGFRMLFSGGVAG
ncbi:hypothetical protein GXU05_005291 [Escherichia coli]|nr:hypothetical protein [Escherichia coli]EFI4238398.1 hypothetical protein [Escherichia coli]EFJ0062847.1 hypothetical protein [Escherichia coli]